MSQWDVFISHASQDKKPFVDALVDGLRGKGLRVWYDDNELKLGDSIRRGIEEGLKKSAYAVVCISPAFLTAEWANKELDSLFAKDSDGQRRIFPILHGINLDEVRSEFPLLANLVTANSSDGVNVVTNEILEAINSRTRSESEADDTPRLSNQLYESILHKKTDYSAILRGKKILIVDDEPAVLKLLRSHFEHKNINATIFLARNGVEALETIASEGSIDLVLTDKLMPKMDGFTLRKHIKTRYPSLPVALITAYWTGSEKKNDKVWEFAACFSKPFKWERLFTGIAEILEKDSLHSYSTSLKQPAYIYHHLCKSRDTAQLFLKMYSDTEDLFEFALRHMLKDVIHEFCLSFKQQSNHQELCKNLFKRLSRLQGFMSDIRHGSRQGLNKILQGIKVDINAASPSIDVSVTISQDVQGSLSSELETFLAFCAIEFAANSTDSLQGEGQLSINMHLMQAQSAVFLSVRDSGHPIPQENLDLIFTEGYSTKGPERGLGLCLIKRMAEYYNSEVQVSQLNGVQFSIKIPLSENNRLPFPRMR